MQSIIIKTVDNNKADAITLGTIDFNGITCSAFGASTIADMVLASLTQDMSDFFDVQLHGFGEDDDSKLRAAVFIHDALLQSCDDARCFWEWHARNADSDGVADFTGSYLEDMTLRQALEASVIVVAKSHYHYIVDEGDNELRIASGAEFLSAYDEEYQAYLDEQAAEENYDW